MTTTMKDVPTTMTGRIDYVINSRNFLTQSHQLSNQFNMLDSQSEALILERIWERLGNKQDVLLSFKDLDWVTTWSRKDVQRNLYKNISWYQEHVNNTPDVLETVLYEPSDGTHQVVPDETLAKIFPDKRSREFVRSILQNGKEETMKQYHLNGPQFNSRLNHRLKYLSKHQELLNRVINTDEHKKLSKQFQVVQDLLDIISTPTLSDEVINSIVQEAFTKYPFMNDYLDQATKDYQLKYQAKVVHDFMDGGLSSRKFIQFLYDRADQLSKQLKGSN